jgi:hypothetical protein
MRALGAASERVLFLLYLSFYVRHISLHISSLLPRVYSAVSPSSFLLQCLINVLAFFMGYHTAALHCNTPPRRARFSHGLIAKN